MSVDGTIQLWSTRSVSRTMRFDYWMNVMRTALWPVTDYRGMYADFPVDLQEARLGRLSSMLETICGHEAHRTRVDVERTEDRSYHLFVSFGPSWGVTHHGSHEELHCGDVVLIGEGQHTTYVPDGFHGVILKCPDDWMRTWLPDPELLLGRAISKDSPWGKVLSPIVTQLTPQLATAPPLPHAVLTDQLGSMLAMVAGEVEAKAMPDLQKKIQACIQERCTESQLTADDVALSLDIPSRFLHRVLSAGRRSFASLLLDARTEAALAMLQAPARQDLSIAEIGRLAGFLSTSHFAREFRKRTGYPPSTLRRSAH